jgi:hypothetical protein
VIRVCNFEMDGITLKLASMSVNEAEAFVKEGNEFIERMKREELKPEEWLTRRNKVVITSLNKAGGIWTEETLKEEFDLPLLDAFYSRLLEFSGLKPGEATAVLASSKSAAA